MASYRGHLAFSSFLGGAYGGLAAWHGEMEWGPVCLGAGLTTLGGLLPDLDSDSSVPVRELFGLAAAATPFLLMHRISHLGFSLEETLVILSGVYLGIRYGLRALLARLTVHRGMFHSLPAMLIAGLLVFLVYQSPNARIRLFLSGAVMLGFLSHLVLDELYGVDLLGSKVRLHRHAGSALKLYSPCGPATLATYLLLAALIYATYLELNPSDETWKTWQDWTWKLFSSTRS
jgi:hypothetical protein